MGFKFPENFNSPLIAQSVTEFWQRWHISFNQLVSRLCVHTPGWQQRRPCTHLPKHFAGICAIGVLAWCAMEVCRPFGAWALGWW